MATMSSSIRYFQSGSLRFTTTRGGANAGTLRIPASSKDFPNGSQGIRRSLRLRCASPFAPEEPMWWATALTPDDLIEPTGHDEPLRPVVIALQEIKACNGNVFRCHCFHAGITLGLLVLVVRICQFHKLAPGLWLDIVLGYIWYKLSVLAAELKRNGKANNICSRIQFVIMLLLFWANNPTKDSCFYFTQLIWFFALHVYSCAVFFECIGVKHPARYVEAMFKTILTTKGGLMKVLA
uniref:Uncharacterized protein n=1 Tax=Leersia perrieri TaxID=77586 RepID=A0A0D9VPH6_9ORYZ